jgi:hypothetical protein
VILSTFALGNFRIAGVTAIADSSEDGLAGPSRHVVPPAWSSTMALTVADNLRRCIERFGANVTNPTRSRSMTQRTMPRYMPPAIPAKVEAAPVDDEPEAAPPAS